MTEKIDNYKLFEGQGLIYRRLNQRFDNLENLVEELFRKMEDQLDDVKSRLDDVLEHLD